MNTDLLQQYCRTARKVMLRHMPINSCISATKVTCECLTVLGFDAVPLTVKMALTVPGVNMVFCSGSFSAEELATAEDSKTIWDGGWRGHLVARVNGLVLLDSSLDQAAAAIGDPLVLPHEIYALPLTDREVQAGAAFKAVYGARLDNGTEIKIEYVTVDDNPNDSYRDTPAWNDENVPLIVNAILTEMVLNTASHRERVG